MKSYCFSLIITLLSFTAIGQELHWQPIITNTGASFRGLSVVDDHTAWVSGSKGWVGHSTDGGNHWHFAQVKGFEKCDFRSLYAFDQNNAIIASAGVPAVVLRTNDGGRNWKVVYSSDDTAVFFDGIDFFNKNEGILYGDPIRGSLLILRTENGGDSWHEAPLANRPKLQEGEASFAASGTTIRCYDNNRIVIATGGKYSRLFISYDKGTHWRIVSPPVIHGENSTGIFSTAFFNERTGVIVGGNYKQEQVKVNHVFCTTDGGSTWKAPAFPTRGYRECVEYLNKNTLIATGPSGTDVSSDGGINWKPVSDEKGFHVVRKSRTGSLIIMAGAEGKISLVKL